MQENTWTDHLIAFLLSARSTKVYRDILWQKARSQNPALKKTAFNQYLYRFKEEGILKNEGEYFRLRKSKLLEFKPFSVMRGERPQKQEKVLISFDIPSTKKKTRDWLRNQIKFWDFEMIHQSLWLGYGPLPKSFYDRLKNLQINKHVRVFRLVRVR